MSFRSDKPGVRPATAADERQWRFLWQSYCDFYDVEIRPEITDILWKRIMDEDVPVYALVAETGSRQGVDAELIGFANYILHPYTWGSELICYLEDLFVAEPARGIGAGTALIDTLIAMSKEYDWPRLYWHTHEENQTARSLYDKFTPVDPFVRYLIKIK